jgi:hypothetical protein
MRYNSRLTGHLVPGLTCVAQHPSCLELQMSSPGRIAVGRDSVSHSMRLTRPWHYEEEHGELVPVNKDRQVLEGRDVRVSFLILESAADAT